MSSIGSVVVYSVCTPFGRGGKDVFDEILNEGGMQRLPIKNEEVAKLDCRVDKDGDVLTIPFGKEIYCDTFFFRLKNIS